MEAALTLQSNGSIPPENTAHTTLEGQMKKCREVFSNNSNSHSEKWLMGEDIAGPFNEFKGYRDGLVF